MDLHKNFYFVFFRVALCGFVDRIAPNPKYKIHEITRNLTKPSATAESKSHHRDQRRLQSFIRVTDCEVKFCFNVTGCRS
jgi:hypothetical protein